MKGRRRVLILSASSGAGHMRAGQALEKAFRARGDCDTEHVDALDYSSKLFQKLYEEAYIAMVRRAPGLMGFLYDGTDTPWKHMRRQTLRRILWSWWDRFSFRARLTRLATDASKKDQECGEAHY